MCGHAVSEGEMKNKYKILAENFEGTSTTLKTAVGGRILNRNPKEIGRN